MHILAPRPSARAAVHKNAYGDGMGFSLDADRHVSPRETSCGAHTDSTGEHEARSCGTRTAHVRARFQLALAGYTGAGTDADLAASVEGIGWMGWVGE